MIFDGPMIVELRTKLGRSQEKFAKLLGVSNVTVCRWESAGKVPRKASQKKLQKLYDFVKEQEEGEK